MIQLQRIKTIILLIISLIGIAQCQYPWVYYQIYYDVNSCSTLENAYYFNENGCVNEYYKYLCDSTGDNVIVAQYEGGGCTGDVVSKNSYPTNQCSGAVQYGCATNYVLPTNSVSVLKGGNCTEDIYEIDDSYQDYVTQVFITITDLCLNQISYSQMTVCNSTTQELRLYQSVNGCGGPYAAFDNPIGLNCYMGEIWNTVCQ
ncbi:hypothetical protein DLAC_05211 [Tieghemostelium lacteum]|uniref:Transmembrane protein n=1 Tax=Tieghemostelium lacteum TaxID=361077 RepID=A0A151ZIM0_TIELA|nr:hypothetical protein DLAC_05211 [Tieghemostelium lacteum]|eukprot:KYQ93813.1 hypothetical protein DLAC_05211 [Tieghemostelium lacteum]